MMQLVSSGSRCKRVNYFFAPAVTAKDMNAIKRIIEETHLIFYIGFTVIKRIIIGEKEQVFLFPHEKMMMIAKVTIAIFAK
jgi:hypothetical protein